MRGSALARTLLIAALQSLGVFLAGPTLRQAADNRLAFRELGLSIGLHAIDRMTRVAHGADASFDAETLRVLRELHRYSFNAASIESFWLQEGNQQAHSWQDHADINAVTLATSLLPAPAKGTSWMRRTPASAALAS